MPLDISNFAKPQIDPLEAPNSGVSVSSAIKGQQLGIPANGQYIWRNPLRVIAQDYGVVADGKTITDGVITGNQLSSVGTPFVQADVGKLVVVPGAGTPTTTTLNETLSTGTPKTTLTVLALPALIAAGGIILNDGAGHTQSISQTGAANGALSIPLSVSTTPNFNYPSGTTSVTTMTPALSTTILSVAGGVATLAASAGTNIASNAEVFYATDDTVAAQAAITAAAGATVEFPTGHIGLSAALATAQPIRILGQSILELFGSFSSGWDAANFPVVAPYLEGTVFVQCAANTDGLQLSGVGVTQDIGNFGVRFAGKFVNTGHGISTRNLPALTAHLDMGPMSARWGSVSVYGHDGNHYGFDCWNMELPRHDDLHAYGGGGYQFAQNATALNSGNLTSTRIYGHTFVAGTAHALFINNATGPSIDYCQFTHAQGWVSNPVAAGGAAIPNTVAPTTAQQMLQVAGALHHIGFVGPDMETNISGVVATRPSGLGCYWLGEPLNSGAISNVPPLGAQVGLSQGVGPPTSGTNYQSTYGVQLVHAEQYLMTPAASATATTTLSALTVWKAKSFTVASAVGFAVGNGIQIDTGSNLECRVITAIASNTISVNAPLSFAHASGVSVLAGAAVVIGQVSQSSLASVPSSLFIADMAWLPIADTNGRSASIRLLVPTAWFVRVDFANATLINTYNNATSF